MRQKLTVFSREQDEIKDIKIFDQYINPDGFEIQWTLHKGS